MTPEEINKINSQRKKSDNKTISKYCPTCKRAREVNIETNICHICGTVLSDFDFEPSFWERVSKRDRIAAAKTRIAPKDDSAPQPKCPTCGSTSISTISDMRRGVHALAFGLFSKTAKSQFECENCGYKW